jgi:hypothetical protein
MKHRLLSLFLLSFLFIISCNRKENFNKSEAIVSSEQKEIVEPSPYFGWFKDKDEFSFTSVSVTTGETGGMKVESTVTSSYYVKNGKEAVKEVTVMNLDGKSQPEKVKVFITSQEENYVLNPLTKKYFIEPGDLNAVMYSTVWLWTRKRSDSYDALSNNPSAIKSTSTINNVNVECYSISGITFCFDSDKKLLKYEGDAAGMHTLILFSDYKEGKIPDFIEESITLIDKEVYSLSTNRFDL